MKRIKILRYLLCFVALVTLLPMAISAQESEAPLSSDTTIQPMTEEELPGARVFTSGTVQECVVIDFEGIGNNTPIGTIPGTPQIPQIIFGSSWLGLIDADSGGSGNFANEPSPNTIAYFLDMNDISIGFDAGVQLVEFYYTAAARSLPVTISAFDEDGNLVDRATGNTIGTSYDGASCSGDPNGQFCLWDKVTLASTSNNIRLISIVGTVSNYFGIDNLRVCVGKCAPPSGEPPASTRIPILDSCCWSNSNNCLEKRDFAGSLWDDCLISEIIADSGEKIQLWCIAGSLPCILAPGAAHYELHYFFPDDSHNKVGVCPFEGGRNDGVLFYAGDSDSNGVPDCFIRTRWTSKDQQAGDQDDDSDGKIDWWVFTYDVVNNNFAKVNYESSDGPGGSDPDVVARTDPELGPETEIMLDELVAEFEQIATPEGVPMGGSTFEPCDLNQDGKCDASDLEIFQTAFESCEGETNFNSDADFNGDGCVTVEDQNMLFPPVIEVDIDIKPGSCPNPLNTKSMGVLPVAVLGTEEFDVTIIDPSTIRLVVEGVEEGVAPLRWDWEDVATPFQGELCDCHDLNGDGYMDLTLKFKTQELAEELELDTHAGETIPLTLTGNLKEEEGSTPIYSQDCVWILEK